MDLFHPAVCMEDLVSFGGPPPKQSQSNDHDHAIPAIIAQLTDVFFLTIELMVTNTYIKVVNCNMMMMMGEELTFYYLSPVVSFALTY